MASTNSTSPTLFLILNLLFFTLSNACHTCPSTPLPPSPPALTPPSPGGGQMATCPRDALKLGVCVNLLNGLLGLTIGTPPTIPCCSLLQGLVDLEVALCLCTALRASVLGINLNIPLSLSLLVNACGGKVPSGFVCA